MEAATDFINAVVLLLNFIVVPGLAYGSQLALGALGITLVFGILRFANFAHGDTMAFGTMITILVTWWLQSKGINLGPLPTALLALPAGILLTIGLLVVTDKTNDQRFLDGERFIIRARDFKAMTGLSEGLSIKLSQGLTIVIAIILVALLFWFLQKTRMGKAMRAYSDNEDLALLSGVDPDRVVLVTWIITATLATIAGTLYGLDKSFKPFTYLQLLLPMFAAAIVGGIGNPIGAIVGGYVIAFSEVIVTYAYKKVFVYLLPVSMEPEGLLQLLSTDYKFAVSFVILVLVLLVRPTGIMRGKLL
jgi:branched-chain amino acid transport system permease protein